jgi:hypothetical protein
MALNMVTEIEKTQENAQLLLILGKDKASRLTFCAHLHCSLGFAAPKWQISGMRRTNFE